MLTALYTVLVFCLIIAIHEFGHFAAAKLAKITVHEFSIGMGTRLLGFRKGDTDYNFRLFPIGGFVKLEGEDEESDDPNAFGNKKPWKRLCVLAAGAFMNFILGFVIFLIISSFSLGFASNIVSDVIEGSAFEKSGIQPGDVIISMEGDNYSTKIHDYNDISYFSYRNGSGAAIVTFKRDGSTFEKKIVPAYLESEKRILFGFSVENLKPTAGRIIVSAYRQSIFVVKVVVNSFADLLKGTVGMSDMSGPVGIVSEINTAAKRGILDVLYLAALISVNLGVVNLLPLPALDGGRIIFVLIELIKGKPVDKNKEGMLHLIGFALLLIFMLSITYMDIAKLL